MVRRHPPFNHQEPPVRRGVVVTRGVRWIGKGVKQLRRCSKDDRCTPRLDGYRDRRVRRAEVEQLTSVLLRGGAALKRGSRGWRAQPPGLTRDALTARRLTGRGCRRLMRRAPVRSAVQPGSCHPVCAITVERRQCAIRTADNAGSSVGSRRPGPQLDAAQPPPLITLCHREGSASDAATALAAAASSPRVKRLRSASAPADTTPAALGMKWTGDSTR